MGLPMFQALLTEARHRQQSKKIHGKEKIE
jgi:hypothetical protein